MRRYYNTNTPILLLQRYLRQITIKHPDIPKVIPDGIYGPQTTATVKAFQKKFGLPQTGKTDNETWDKIIDVHKQVLNEYTEPRSVEVFPSPAFTVKSGDENEIVPVIQALLYGISKRFLNIEQVQITGIYDEQTKGIVLKIQEIAQLPLTGEIDKNTWDAIARLFETAVSKSRLQPFDRDSEHIIRLENRKFAPYDYDNYAL